MKRAVYQGAERPQDLDNPPANLNSGFQDNEHPILENTVFFPREGPQILRTLRLNLHEGYQDLEDSSHLDLRHHRLCFPKYFPFAWQKFFLTFCGV